MFHTMKKCLLESWWFRWRAMLGDQFKVIPTLPGTMKKQQQGPFFSSILFVTIGQVEQVFQTHLVLDGLGKFLLGLIQAIAHAQWL